jgi:hypothetical protein
MKKYSLVLFLALLSGLGFSQATNVSPYSRYALGDINPGWFAQNTAMGGTTVSMVDSFQVNVLNPASYCFTAYQSPVLDVSFRGRFIDLSTNSSSTKANYFHVNNIVLALPVSKRFGAAIGLLPFSTSGYNITFSQVNESVGGTVNTFYQGQGGINRAFLGLSFMPVRTKTNMFSIGANFSYLFGDLQKTRKLIYPNETGLFNSKITNSIFARDFMFDGGIYYRNIINPRQQVSIGFATSLGTSLSCNRSVLAHTIAPVSEAFVDTVLYIESEKGSVFIPPKYNIGLTYDFKASAGSKNSNYKLTLSAQYNFQDWSKYTEEFPSSVYSDTLNSTSGINFGVQYIPHVLAVGSGKVKPLKLVNYRAGFYTSKNYLNIDNNSINNWGVTCGLGIPLWASSLSYSMLNLSFEYGSRGTTSNNLLLEKYYGFHIGFAFCPSRVDRWFVKRKYD